MVLQIKVKVKTTTQKIQKNIENFQEKLLEVNLQLSIGFFLAVLRCGIKLYHYIEEVVKNDT